MSSLRHVLIVDDHEDTLDLITKAFADRGFRVTVARNGREGLDALLHDHATTPTAVLLDLNMPLMSGDEFLAIKQLYSRLAVIPVFVITASEERLRHPIVVGHFQKPLDPLSLVQAVQDVVTAGSTP